MKKFLSLTFSLLNFWAVSQTSPTMVKFINPSSIAKPKGYTQTVQIDLGASIMVIISGQVPLDKDGNLVGKDNFSAQATQVYQNLKNIVEEAGGTMDNIVKTGIFMIDIAQIQTLREIRNKFVNLNNPPASTLVQVNKLFRDDVLIEIEATAIIPKK